MIPVTLRSRRISLLACICLLACVLGLPGVTYAEDDPGTVDFKASDRGGLVRLIEVGDLEGLMGYGSSSGRTAGTLSGDAFSWRGTNHTVTNLLYNSSGQDADDWSVIIDIFPVLSEGIECLALYVGGAVAELCRCQGERAPVHLAWGPARLDRRGRVRHRPAGVSSRV